jgi:N6-L-threonylcarbamoyladenine synthase
MGLPYPGGPHVQRYAGLCTDPAAALKKFPLPRPLAGRTEPDFSFSGLKTAVRAHIDALPPGDLAVADVADMAYALQDAISAVIADRCEKAVQIFLSHYSPEAPALVVSGGVAANVGIRAALTNLAARHGMAFHAPPVALCSDNGAMIAWTGIERLRKNMSDTLDIAARPRWPLDPDAAARA